MKKTNGNSLRIAMFGHKRIPSREGGIEVVVGELSRRMAGLGHPVTCFNRSGHHVSGAAFDGENRKEYEGVRLKSVWTLNKKGLAAMTASLSAAVLAAFGPYDAVHVHAEGPAFMCWLPKLMGKRVVVTVHGLDWARAKWGKFASWYIKSGEKNAVRFADEIIVLSRAVQDYFQRTYGRKTRFIPNGVNPPELLEPEEIRDRWGLEKDGYVLFLGRLVPEKGIHYLLKAYQGLRTDKKLVIAGGSSDTAEYAKELQALAPAGTVFTGFLQGRALQELYSNAYVYVLPSDLEGMPLTLLEAMNYGCCCVTSDIGECADVMDGCGFTFPRGTVEALRETLQDLCDHPEKVEAHRGEARKVISSKYTWQDITAQTDGLYKKLLGD